MHKVDALVGGGPAGLLAALHLSKRHQVALIDRSILGKTKKFWITTERRLEKNGLGDCILYKSSRMHVGTFLGGHALVQGDFAVVDDERALALLIHRCKEHGVQFFEGCELLNLTWSHEGILAHSSHGTFLARVLGDASGGMSPLAATFRLHKIDGYYSVYGGLLENVRLHSPDIIVGHISKLGDPPPIWK